MPITDSQVPRRAPRSLTVVGSLAIALVVPVSLPAAAEEVLPSAPGSTAVADEIYIDRFVQEGTPAPVGGRFVQLDPFYVEVPSYSMTKGGPYPSEEISRPAGVLDTAFMSAGSHAAVYRSDGSTEKFDEVGSWLPDVPSGSQVVSMAGGSSFGAAFAVTSAGELVAGYWEWDQILPSDPRELGYTAVAGGDDVFYAIRTTGELVGFAKPADEPRLACVDHWTPAAGTRYVAISAMGTSWMALRSDGVVVTCGYGPDGADRFVGEVHSPSNGSTFIGVDAGENYGLAASSEGDIVSFGSTGLVPAQPAAGAEIVGLSAGAETGASVLSDGTLMTWGEPISMPEFPAGTDRFVAISENQWGFTQAIWAHEVLDLDIEVTVPASVRIGQTAHARVDVAYDGAYQPDGHLCLVDLSERGDALCSYRATDGTGTIPIPTDVSDFGQVQRPGIRTFGFGFINPLGRMTYTTATFEVLPPATTQLRGTVPSTYEAGAEVSAIFELDVEDETVPAGYVALRAIIGEDDDALGHTEDDVELGYARMDSTGPVRVDVDSTALTEGEYQIKANYVPDGNQPGTPTAPAQWRGTITVGAVFSVPRSPSVSGTPQVGKTLTAVRGPWTPSPTKTTYQWRVNGRAVSGATSSAWKVTSSAKGKKVSVAITGSKSGYLTRTLVSPATAPVKAGVFVAPAPTISGTARVGSTLQVYRGTWTPLPSTVTHQWKIDGRSVAGATRSTFRVPTSARGKRVSVVVTGSLAGYTTKSVSKSTGLIR
jgi:hypothetical protein